MEEEENPENYHQNNNNENNNINNNNQENEGSQEEENLEDNDDNKLMYIYEWVDSIPLSRQKKKYIKRFQRCCSFSRNDKIPLPPSGRST